MPTQPAVHSSNEYSTLKKVIVVSPTFMEIREVINEVQASYAAENIDKTIAVNQHEGFVRTLKDEGVNVIQLRPDENLNEQVFTRDIGFTVDRYLFVSNMEKDLRKPETERLKQWLRDQEIPYQQLTAAPIEGGDVIVDEQTLWIGISDRTNKDAAKELQEKLPDFEVNQIPIREDVLHLDCTFNLLNSETALIYKDGIRDKQVLQKLENRYELIEVTKEEQFQMGTNVLSIGGHKVISLPENSRINTTLKEKGFHVIEVPFSEIIKSGGSFRCCSLPLLRQ
jgi:N-dimethylarginine dimethylaminohydrolase